MRNKWLLIVGSALIVLSVVLLAAGAIWPIAMYIGLIGVLLVLGGLLVGRRYRVELTAPPEGFVATGEHFKDPGSGQLIAVYENASTGERAYVLETAPQDGRDG